MALVKQTAEEAFPGCPLTVGCCSGPGFRVSEQFQLEHLQRRPHGIVQDRHRRRSYAKQRRGSVQVIAVHSMSTRLHPWRLFVYVDERVLAERLCMCRRVHWWNSAHTQEWCHRI